MSKPALAVILLLVLAAAAAAAWIVRRWTRASSGPSQHAVFLGLCRVHALGKAARKLLARFARRINCQEPARLFVDPRLWERAAAAGLPADDTERLQELSRTLFAER
jgi:hypothetical protein